ncbi:MAG: phosphotransferase family protein [Chloroflexi bacterium]|nr:phosphotransferase family protein [Chloroflexota bacterium]
MDWRDRLVAYLREQLPSADSVAIARVMGMPAGASNDTVGLDVEVTCDGQRSLLQLVLRPQRRDGILAPYDVGRQFRVMRALSRTAVPVPATMWHEATGAVLGTPFFVMQRVAGETLPLFWYGSQSPRLRAVAEALAGVHAVDWRSAGLEFLLPEGAATPSPLACDLAQWKAKAAHLEMAHHRDLVALGEFLAANEPADARHALLHGDPNPGNYLLDGDRVAAVVDWEVAAIGDPRSDLGFYAALLTVFGGMSGEGGQTVLSAAYEQVTGEPLADLDYYEAVGLYKMAIVMAGWAGRGGWGYYGTEAISRRLTFLFGPRWAG